MTHGIDQAFRKFSSAATPLCDFLRSEIRDLRRINLSVNFHFRCPRRPPGENSIEDPITKSTLAREARYIDSPALFAHLKHRRSFSRLKTALSPGAEIKRGGGGCLARVARGGSTERTDAAGRPGRGRGCRDVVRRGCTGWDLICVPFHAQPSGTFLPHFAARFAFAPHRRVD